MQQNKSAFQKAAYYIKLLTFINCCELYIIRAMAFSSHHSDPFAPSINIRFEQPNHKWTTLVKIIVKKAAFLNSHSVQFCMTFSHDSKAM